MLRESNVSEADTLEMDREKRQKVRQGMRLVLEDRIYQTEVQGSLDPLNELLDYIQFEFQNGYTVGMVIHGIAIINGCIYTARDGLIGIREHGKPLFIIYTDQDTGRLSLSFNDFDLMDKEEQDFYTMIANILTSVENPENFL